MFSRPNTVSATINESLDRFALSAAVMKQPEEKLFIISDALTSGLVNGYNEQGYSEDKLIEERCRRRTGQRPPPRPCHPRSARKRASRRRR